MKKRTSVWLVLGAALGGCGAGFDPISYVNGLRALVVHAEPAEADFGQSITLTALAVDTEAQPITYEWSICNLATTVTSGAIINPDCAAPDGGTFLQPIGSGPQTTFTPQISNLKAISLDTQTFGAFLPVRLTVRAPGPTGTDPPRVVTGMFRTRIHVPLVPMPNETPDQTAQRQKLMDCEARMTVSPYNHNPTLAGIWIVPDTGIDFTAHDGGPTLDDFGPASDMGPAQAPHADAGIPPIAVELGGAQALEIHEGETWALRALFTNDSFEHFCGIDSMAGVIERTETPSVRWFTTAGRFDSEGPVTGQENAVKFIMPLRSDKTYGSKVPAASGTPIDLYAVGRDDRGGNTWLHRTVIFR